MLSTDTERMPGAERTGTITREPSRHRWHLGCILSRAPAISLRTETRRHRHERVSYIHALATARQARGPPVIVTSPRTSFITTTTSCSPAAFLCSGGTASQDQAISTSVAMWISPLQTAHNLPPTTAPPSPSSSRTCSTTPWRREEFCSDHNAVLLFTKFGWLASPSAPRP